jgi:putative MATE family efflux protein
MQVGITYKEILRVSYPVMIGALATTVLNATDTAFLGRVGEIELGASAIGGVLYFALAMIGTSLGIGTQILIARRAGEKKESEIGKIFDHSIGILFILGMFLFLCMIFFSSFLLDLVVGSKEISLAATEFLKFRSWGIIFLMLATAYRSFYVGIAKPKVFGWYAFIMAALNIILCYCLIFGYAGFPKMGIAGAGLASSLSEFISLLFLVFYTKLKPDIRNFKLFLFGKWQPAMFKSIVNLSAPIIMQNLLSMGAWLVFFLFIEKIGAHELAISNIVRAAYMVSMTPMWGFSVAANSMISNVIGQGRKDEVMLLLNRILKLTFLCTVLMVLINVIFSEEILSVFTSDMNLVYDSFGTFWVINIAMFFFSFAIVCISAVSGTGATKTALYIEVASIIIYLIYVYVSTFIISKKVETVWFSEVIYWGVTGLVSYVYLRTDRWKKIVL